MRSKLLFFILVFFVLIPCSLAADQYKPYIHKPSVPQHPEIKLYGQYQTQLFPGSATYLYPIPLPKGTNGLQPSIVISYSSQSATQRPGILGAGWSISENYIYRDVNGTPDSVADDEFKMVLDGSQYELIYNPSDGLWHTEVEYHFKILNFSGALNTFGMYWLVKKKDGTTYRFGYNSDSELTSNTGKNYTLKWSLDLIQDTHSNSIYYSYSENPYSGDTGAVYLNQISYNAGQERKIEFSYESSVRPDRRLVYWQGNTLEESRRLTDISVSADYALISRHHISYITLTNSLSSISEITMYGSDSSSMLYNISFDYNLPTYGYDNKTSSWTPPVIFSDDNYDYGVRLVDVNNDGFVDIVKGDNITGTKTVWLNNKISGWASYEWALPVWIVFDSSRKDEGVRFADVNKDGFVDLLKSKSGTRLVYLNNGTGWALNTSWTLPSTIDFADSSTGADLGVQIGDINGDSRVDLVDGKNNKTYLQNGFTWTISSITLPELFVDASNNDLGLRLVDVNSDGLDDILKGIGGTRIAWLNNGSGWINSSQWQPPADFVSGTSDNGIRFADVNGDGLVDILEDYANGATTEKGAWINTGSGWISNSNWQPAEAFTKDGKNTGRRLVDVNGDGFADIIVSHSGFEQHTALKNATPPYVLRQVINEYGGITLINYTTSTRFNNSDADGLSDIGFNLYVVSNVTTNNSMSNSFNVLSITGYNYSNGKYNYQNNEFRGFGLSTEITPSAIVKHYYYQDDPRRAKEYQTEIYNLSGNLYSKNTEDYNYTYSNGIYNISLRLSTDYLFDGSSEAKVINTSYLYDWYHNPLYVAELGDAYFTGDEKYYNYSYAYNRQDWIMDKVARVSVYDYSNNKVKETKYYYDERGLGGIASIGDLTQAEQWLSNGNNSFNYFTYDSYGNMLSQTDALGNTQKYSYDEYNTFLDMTVNALGHVTYYDFDFGTGNLNWVEKNDVRTSYSYDVFGRITKEIKPYDGNSLPTKYYTYYFDGTAPESIKISLKTTSNKTNNIWYYYDGFGNLVQIKTDVENNRQIVKNLYYDTTFRVKAEDNPYFDSYNASLSTPLVSPQTNYTYDAVDRVVSVLNPDGTSKNVSFDRWNITDFDENGHKHMYSLDAFGRIVKVFEYNNDLGYPYYETSYEYDTSDNLVKITDTLGNVFSFTYDTLGRKIAMKDPDLGSWSYGYDKNSNLLWQTDSRNKTISLSYDVLNRIKTKNSTDVNISFAYDKDYYGTLSNITMYNVTIKFEYDDRLRVTKETKILNGITFETNLLYDSQDRLLSKQGLSELQFIYNLQGKVKTIPGFINDSYYNAFGSIINRTYGNNLKANYSYNSLNNRLQSIKIPNVQNLSYTYDSVGNILTIIDAVNNKNYSMAYDNLDRMTSANISSDRYAYAYNPIGNIMKIVYSNGSVNTSKKFVYAGNQSHAPSTIIEGSPGVDVYNLHELTSGTKNRTFEVFLINDKITNLTGVNLSFIFGDGKSFNGTGINITTNVMAFVQTNYSKGGDYKINVTAKSAGSVDWQNITTKFGLRVNNLLLNYSNVTQRTFGFSVRNDISETVYNVTWHCTDGLNSTVTVNLGSSESITSYIQKNYTSPGDKTFTCLANSTDGNETKTVSFTVKGFEIDNYDVLMINISRRIISFDVWNYFIPAKVNISVQMQTANFSKLVNISSNTRVMAFVEVNYISDGPKIMTVDAISTNYSTNYSQKYVESFTTEGVSIENYSRVKRNNSVYAISFDIVNHWHNQMVYWNISNPFSSNNSVIANNQSVHVYQENSYSQGTNKVEILARVSTFVDRMTDIFEVRPLQIYDFQTLKETLTSSVFEIMVQNNLNTTQQFNWTLNTGIRNISNLANVTGYAFVFVETNYSATGVYKTRAYVNKTTYNDTQNGVTVI